MTEQNVGNSIKQIYNDGNITKEQLSFLLQTKEADVQQELFKKARSVADRHYGKQVFVRGLIEFTNYCKNNCYYCGIRCENKQIKRYRLSHAKIMERVSIGYEIGYRTIVLQGGEDAFFTDQVLCELISDIKGRYPDCAVTLSVGERSRESYRRLFDAGADRYLLRHETADQVHYGMLHPDGMSFLNRMKCLQELKQIGYQVGCGFMVGSPQQTIDTVYQDLQFIREFRPHMVGIGPFIPQKDTPFGNRQAGTLESTLRLLAIIRLLHPKVLLPATTALGTIHPKGRELGILAGANVVMPNLSPVDVRENYALYDHKLCTGEEAAEGLAALSRQMERIGYQVVSARGDSLVVS